MDIFERKMNEKLLKYKSEIERLKKEREHSRDWMAAIKALVIEQANDEGIWFIAQTVSEEYLQQELRKLHSMIERAE